MVTIANLSSILSFYEMPTNDKVKVINNELMALHQLSIMNTYIDQLFIKQLHVHA